MGVKLLQTYMERCVKNGVFKVDIQEEVEHYKRTHGGQEPLIVIDLLAVRQILCTSEHEAILGGRYNMYNERATNLFSRIKSLGVKLVFFTDGTTPKEKTRTRFMRITEEAQNTKADLEMVYSGADLSVNRYAGARAPMPFFSLYKELVRPFGPVHISVLNECDVEIAAYATKHKALAVLSNDTDFLIYQGKWRFWSSKKFDIANLKTVEYNREALRTKLWLKDDQMALFATMSGNDIILYDSLRDFHRKATRNKGYSRNEFHFRAVADQLLALRFNQTFTSMKSISTEQAKFISRLIFDREDDEAADLVKSSLKSYDYSQLNRNHDSEILAMTSQGSARMNFILLSNTPHTIRLRNFDLSKDDLKPFFTIISPLLQRIMGIILNDDPKPAKRVFYSKLSEEKELEKIVLKAEYPSYEVPPLKHLLFCEIGQDLSLDKSRLDLVCWLISPKLTPDMIKNLPENNAAYCLTLLYLVELQQITVEEADFLLLACNCPSNIREELELSEIKTINERDCRIAFLFVGVQIHIKNCFFAVGWDKICHYMEFDGLYFHHLRRMGNSLLAASMLPTYESLRIYAN